mmetsp:Transcript_26111/g.53217  ORF Transcript_26111/g.53217 Transcript_26111/m.53217 type:complete len:224 (-) Transcript_26111:1264-1935(-)
MHFRVERRRRADESPLAHAHGIRRDKPRFDRLVLRPERERDLHVVCGASGDCARGAVALLGAGFGEICVLVVDGDQTEVDVLEEGVVVGAVRGHREEGGLLKVQRHLGRKRIEELEPRRLEVGQSNEGVHCVLHAHRPRKHPSFLPQLLLIKEQRRLVLSDVGVDDALELDPRLVHAPELPRELVRWHHDRRRCRVDHRGRRRHFERIRVESLHCQHAIVDLG